MDIVPQQETLETILQQAGPERLKAMLLWFHADQSHPDYSNEQLNAVLGEVQQLDVERSYQLLNLLDTDELVGYSLINEFGRRFSQKACFSPLKTAVASHLRRGLFSVG